MKSTNVLLTAGLWSAFVLGFCVLDAQVVNFDSFTPGTLSGQQGWVQPDPSYLGSLFVETPIGGGSGMAAGTVASNRVDYGRSFHSYGASFAPNQPFTDDGKITIQFDFNIGADTFGGFGFRIPQYAEIALITPYGEFFGARYYSASPPVAVTADTDVFAWTRNPYDHVAGDQYSNTTLISRDTWYTAKFVYDYNAPAGGQPGGTINAYFQMRGAGNWMAIAGIDNAIFAYGLSGTFTLASEIDSIGIYLGSNSQIDNILITSGDGPSTPDNPITPVPESASVGLVGAILLVGLVFARNVREKRCL